MWGFGFRAPVSLRAQKTLTVEGPATYTNPGLREKVLNPKPVASQPFGVMTRGLEIEDVGSRVLGGREERGSLSLGHSGLRCRVDLGCRAEFLLGLFVF